MYDGDAKEKGDHASSADGQPKSPFLPASDLSTILNGIIIGKVKHAPWDSADGESTECFHLVMAEKTRV